MALMDLITGCKLLKLLLIISVYSTHAVSRTRVPSVSSSNTEDSESTRLQGRDKIKSRLSEIYQHRATSVDYSQKFRIRFTEDSATGEELCLQLISPKVGMLKSKPCKQYHSAQKFIMDEDGRIHPYMAKFQCIVKIGPTLRTKFCNNPNNSNRFIYNLVEGSLAWRTIANKVFTLKDDVLAADSVLQLVGYQPNFVTQRLQIVYDDVGESTQDWSQDYVSTDDESKTINIKLNGTELCLQPTDVNAAVGSKTELATCNGTILQQWKIVSEGMIRNAKNVANCLQNSQLELSMAACSSSNQNNQFAFNFFDGNILWKKSGLKVFDVKGSNIFDVGSEAYLTKVLAGKASQQWAFESPPVVNVTLVSESCSDGACGLCYGPCELDSDCNSGLRCAHRDLSSGDENVPGCEWGSSDALTDDNYCFEPIKTSGIVNYVGECSTEDYSCGLCEGNCLNDDDCDGELVCFARTAYEDVPGCSGAGGSRDVYGKSICYDPNMIRYVGSDCTSEFADGLCDACSGDCDSDADCEGSLRCAQRVKLIGKENVPGCGWAANDESLKMSDDDFCFNPVNLTGIINYVGECGVEDYLCKECEGGCRSDYDCEGFLQCQTRTGFQAVSGCQGEGGERDVHGKNICYDPYHGSFQDALKIDSGGCSSDQPCDECVGPCSSNDDCDSGLTCFARVGSEPVPGCVSGGSGDIADTGYCYLEPTNGPVTYIPGMLSVQENGLKLSKGLKSRIIAKSGNSVSLFNGNSTIAKFHKAPDAGAIFSVTEGDNAGGWIYVSNSENGGGGVGAITFNSAGDVIDYQWILNSKMNCGGGKTYWGTWVTCEENGGSGQVWEVNPFIGLGSGQQTVLGANGGNYESFAYDARDRFNPTFYVTEDSGVGALTRFTPNPWVVKQAEETGDYSKVLTTMGTLEWLLMFPTGGSWQQGTIEWTTQRGVGRDHAAKYFPGSEGIDIRDGKMYFVSKTRHFLFIVDLDAKTFVRSSTTSGAFSGQPDQIRSLVGDDGDTMLYFCEDSGWDHGIHARDIDGNFYTIIDSTSYSSETSGLAFSPDNRRMYISYQWAGLIFEIWREDGYPFGAKRLDIKYHAT